MGGGRLEPIQLKEPYCGEGGGGGELHQCSPSLCSPQPYFQVCPVQFVFFNNGIPKYLFKKHR